MKQSFFNYSFSEFESLLRSRGLNSSAASLLFNWYYKKKNTSRCTQNISKETLEYLDQEFSFDLPKLSKAIESSDKTVKFLVEFNDSESVECVLIPFHNKYSICLSSQVGCSMNCSFCYTGKQGLVRNLMTSEIIGQFLLAWQWLKQNRPGEERILNIVFMGQGEPLHNFDNIKNSCEIFLSKHGTSIAAQKITVSTCGYIPGLTKWNKEMPKVNLALSLHSVNNLKRDELIPINKKYPLQEVLKIIDGIELSKKQFVTYEYLLIKDFNDTDEDAQELGKCLKGKEAYINLIPFNPFSGSKYQRPSMERVEAFKAILDTYKIPTLIRAAKGDDVLAACGQLNSSK